MTAALWVALAVAFISGGGVFKSYDAIKGLVSSRSSQRRSEVDRMSELLADAEARARVAARRERIATEWGHRNAVLAIRAGVPEAEMPILNFQDD